MSIVSSIKRAAAVAITAVVAVGVVALPASAATPRQVAGVWSGTDVDGSTQYLVVTTRQRAFYFDDGASVCLDAFGEFSPATFRGRGTISGNTLSVPTDVTCWLSTGPQVVLSDVVIEFDFDAGPTGSRRDDALVDLNGCTLVRPGGSASSCP